MLRFHEDVEAEDALQERRVAEADDAVVFFGEFETDRDQPTFGVAAPRVKRR